MTVTAAFAALEAMRCEGVAENRHYPVSAFVSNVAQTPALIWDYSFIQDGVFTPEIYDLQAGMLRLGAKLTLLTNGYAGVGQADEVADVKSWADRIMAMLQTDMLLGDSLAVPLSGGILEIGLVEWRKHRYVGLIMELNLIVRVEAP